MVNHLERLAEVIKKTKTNQKERKKERKNKQKLEPELK